MNDLIGKDKEYFVFIQEIKKQVQNAQIKAAVSVNQGLLQLGNKLLPKFHGVTKRRKS